MKKFMFATLAMIMILTLSAFRAPSVLAAPAPPDGTRVLIALLSGPAIDGVVPSGKAEVTAFQSQAALDFGASNLNLVDGTCLDIAFGKNVFTGIPVIGGGASFSFSPLPEQVRPGEPITVSIGEPPADQTSCLIILQLSSVSALTAPATGTVILSGTFQNP